MGDPAGARHVAHLPGGQWGVWRRFALRTAGFPIESVTALGCADLLAAADRLAGAHEALMAALDAASSRSDVPLERSNLLGKLSRRLRAATDPVAEILAMATTTGSRLATLQLSEVDDVVAAARAFEVTYVDAVGRCASSLRDVARDPRFRSAVLWQNRRAVRSAVDEVARGAHDPPTKSDRQRMQLVARYLQRYCTKNETIGFFGPIGWGAIVEGGVACEVPDDFHRIAAERVEFENWGIDALAARLADAHPVRPWLAPRLYPFVRVEHGTLHVATMPSMPLDGAQTEILLACDGTTSAREIAARVVGAGIVPDEAACFELLQRAAEMGLLSWTLEVSGGPQPEILLREALAGIPDPHRREMLDALDSLVAAREALPRSPRDDQELAWSLERLDETFHRLTGEAPTRFDGSAYAARTLVYQDCVRGAEVALGPPLLERLGPSLSLVLDSARWFTSEASRRFRGELVRLHGELSAATGDAAVELALLHQAFLTDSELVALDRRPCRVLAGAVSALHERWARILQLDPQAPVVMRSSDDVRGAVREAFPDAGRPWSAVPHLSPDVLVAAASLEAVANGASRFVLGEVHCKNTLEVALWMMNHPDVEWFRDANAVDCPRPRVVMALPRDWMWHQRGVKMLNKPTDRHYVFGRDPMPSADPAALLRVADLVVVRRADSLDVISRDGRERFDVIDFLADYLSDECSRHFGIVAPADHVPRILLDEMIISRRRWSAPAAALSFAWRKSAAARYRGACELARRFGARRMFVRSPAELKPMFVDFASPVYVEELAKTIRATRELDTLAKVTFAEMVPDVDDLWVSDTESRHVTSELRFVAVERSRA